LSATVTKPPPGRLFLEKKRVMTIRKIDTALITRTITQLCVEATTILNPDVLDAYSKGSAQ
jgi:hypothetical protein